MPDKKKQKEIVYNSGLSTLYADSLQFSSRSDDIMFLRFLTHTPEGLSEQARIIIPKRNLQGMLDILCNSLKYQPKMDKSEEKEK